MRWKEKGGLASTRSFAWVGHDRALAFDGVRYLNKEFWILKSSQVGVFLIFSFACFFNLHRRSTRTKFQRRLACPLEYHSSRIPFFLFFTSRLLHPAYIQSLQVPQLINCLFQKPSIMMVGLLGCALPHSEQICPSSQPLPSCSRRNPQGTSIRWIRP